MNTPRPRCVIKPPKTDIYSEAPQSSEIHIEFHGPSDEPNPTPVPAQQENHRQSNLALHLASSRAGGAGVGIVPGLASEGADGPLREGGRLCGEPLGHLRDGWV